MKLSHSTSFAKVGVNKRNMDNTKKENLKAANCIENFSQLNLALRESLYQVAVFVEESEGQYDNALVKILDLDEIDQKANFSLILEDVIDAYANLDKRTFIDAKISADLASETELVVKEDGKTPADEKAYSYSKNSRDIWRAYSECREETGVDRKICMVTSNLLEKSIGLSGKALAIYHKPCFSYFLEIVKKTNFSKDCDIF